MPAHGKVSAKKRAMQGRRTGYRSFFISWLIFGENISIVPEVIRSTEEICTSAVSDLISLVDAFLDRFPLTGNAVNLRSGQDDRPPFFRFATLSTFRRGRHAALLLFVGTEQMSC
jgi:hypothetical protein